MRFDAQQPKPLSEYREFLPPGVFQRDDVSGIGAVQMPFRRVAFGAGPVQLPSSA